MKILKNGQWITPVIDNSKNTNLKVFFDGRWNNILTKDEFLATAPQGTQYIDEHLVYVYVRGVWHQIAIEEDIANFTVVTATLSFKNQDLKDYTSNVQIRPENSYLSTARVMTSTGIYKTTGDAGYTVTSGIVGTDSLFKLQGFTKILHPIKFNTQTVEEFDINGTSPKAHSSYFEIENKTLALHTINTDISHKDEFEVVVEGDCKYHGKHMELSGVLVSEEIIKFNRATKPLLTYNTDFGVGATYIELGRMAMNTIPRNLYPIDEYVYDPMVVASSKVYGARLLTLKEREELEYER